MKNAIILVVLFPVFIIGQSTKSTVFGIKGGLNFSDIEAKEINGEKNGYRGTELYGGFFADTQLKGKLHLENGLLFSYTDDIHFIEVPIVLKYYFHPKWNFYLGPKLNFIADNQNEKTYYEFRNFGVAIDVGIQFDISKRLLSEMSYSRSLSSQIKETSGNFYGGKRHVFRLGLGFKF